MGGIAEKVIRDKFYKEMIEEYGTSREEIIRILANAGQNSFSADEVSLHGYRILIKAFFTQKKQNKINAKEERIKAVEKDKETKEAWRNLVFINQNPTPCPITGCGGVMLHYANTSVKWYCSKGGKKHYTALKVANMWARANKIEDNNLINEKATHFAGLRSLYEEEETEKQLVA